MEITYNILYMQVMYGKVQEIDQILDNVEKRYNFLQLL